MRNKKFAALLVILLSFTLVFTACDAVGGMNMNKIMTSALEEESYEANMNISIEFIPGDYSWLAENNDQLAMLSFFPNIDVHIHEYKQQSLTTASMAGDISMAGIIIPFAMSITPEEMVIEVEGITRPIVFDLTAPYSELGLEIDLQQLNEGNVNYAKAFYNYLVPNLPNPDTVNVSFETIAINGENHNVRKIHAEIHGNEIFRLVEKLLANLVEDEQGLREFLDELYDFIQPILDQAIHTVLEMEEPDVGERFAIDLVLAYLNNKTLVTEFLYTTVHNVYQFLLDQLDGFEASLADKGVTLNDSYAIADLYVNNNMSVIRSDIELFLSAGSADPNAEAGGILITGSTQKWNINEPVESDILSSDNGIIVDEFLNEDQLLYAIDAESTLGQILMAVGLNTKMVYIWVDEADVLIDNNNTLLNAIDLMYELGVDVDWNSWYSDEVIITDGVTTVILPKGQNIMIVNGVEIEIPVGAREEEYSIYVPLRAVAEAFGFEVSWDPVYRTVDLIKTYF